MLRRGVGIAAFALTLLAPSLVRADAPGPHHGFQVTRGAIAGKPNHTLFRPGAVPFRMPIVVWGNGGCRESNEEFRYFLTKLASYGYFVVANGRPEHPYNPAELRGLLDPKPERLLEGLDWALKQDGVDPSRVVVMGQSCGGWEATTASNDPRVDTTIIWDSGAGPFDPKAARRLHAPVLYAYGGVTDYALLFPLTSYTQTKTPAVIASHRSAGHTGLFDDPMNGPPPSPLQNEPLVLAAHWLSYTLYGRTAGRDFYLGERCGLCTRRGWSVQSKNWGAFTMKPSEAPRKRRRR